MKKFKTIGILGGMGPAASAHFYQLLLKKSQEKYHSVQDDEYPQIIINSLALSGSSEQGMENNELITNQLIAGVKVLENAGADFVVIPCNSVHNVIDAIRENVSIPVISIIESVSNEVIRSKSNKVLVLCSETSKKYGLYNGLSSKKLSLIKPKKTFNNKVTKVIFSVMANKNISESAKPVIQKINNLHSSQIIDSVILGCTELPLAISQKDIKAKVYDSLEILAEIVLNYAKNDTK